jgi:hypothetical protein
MKSPRVSSAGNAAMCGVACGKADEKDEIANVTKINTA